MKDLSRAEFIQGMTAAAAIAASGLTVSVVMAKESNMSAKTNAFEYQHTPVPLPFDPKSLKGLSDRLIVSHWESNYGGAVKALNVVRGRLAQALSDVNTPPYVYNGLKREQLMRTGSVLLHELYFGNLGGDGGPDAGTRSRLAVSFGSTEAWEAEFRKIGQGLGGGSGWVVLGYNRRFGVLENYWLADHLHGPAETDPILVMDMYEHSYQMDYGAAAARYIDAFFANIRWEQVAARLAAAS